MKKILPVILVLLLFSACKSPIASIEPCLKGITFDCKATYYNEVYECKGGVQPNGDTEIEFISPVEIKGLKFNFSKNGVKANFKDTEYKAQKIVFENAVATFISDVLTAENTEVLKQDNVFYTEGVTKDFEYKLQLGGTGLPIKITTKPDAVEVEFKNVKIK